MAPMAHLLLRVVTGVHGDAGVEGRAEAREAQVDVRVAERMYTWVRVRVRLRWVYA